MIESVTVDQVSGTVTLARVAVDAGATAPASTPPAAAGPAAPSAASTRPARAAARNWPSFRGESASGNGDGQRAVAEWDTATGKNRLVGSGTGAVIRRWLLASLTTDSDGRRALYAPNRPLGQAVTADMAADIVLLDVEWPARALLRAQLIEEGFDVLATDTWAQMRRYLRPGSKPQLAIVDLQGLSQPEQVLRDLNILMPPERVLVLSALGTVAGEESIACVSLMSNARSLWVANCPSCRKDVRTNPSLVVIQPGPHPYCRQVSVRDRETRGVQSVDISRGTDLAVAGVAHSHAAIGV